MAFQQIHTSQRSLQKMTRNSLPALSKNGPRMLVGQELKLHGDTVKNGHAGNFVESEASKWKKVMNSSIVFLLKLYSNTLKLLIGSFLTLDLVRLLIGVSVQEIEEKIPLCFLTRYYTANFTPLDLIPLFAILFGHSSTRHKAYRNFVYKWLWMWYDFDVDRITDVSSLALVCIAVGAALRSVFRAGKALHKNWLGRQRQKAFISKPPLSLDSSTQGPQT